MEKMTVIVASIFMLILSGIFAGVNSDDIGCSDGCSMGCINTTDHRVQSRCEIKCQIQCAPEFEANKQIKSGLLVN